MATDLERLVVQLSADLKGYDRAMQRASGVAAREARKIETTWEGMNRRLSRTTSNLGRGLVAPLTGLAAALSVREVIAYADAWTQAGNRIRSAAQVAGREARSLEGINEIANSTRSGIAETAELYSRLLTATRDVAKSEEEVARATEIVNKAFKAGGAAASEQAAGITQLSQALGSGSLQGDELRSLRENAPLLAKAIADEFGTTIAGLKELGAEGELTSERVFKAILRGQPQIQAAFAATNQTIGDAFNKLNNQFTQYIGQTDGSLNASQRLIAGLNALADNFDATADAVIAFASILAAGLLGRAIAGMIAQLGLAGGALFAFLANVRKVQTVGSLAIAMGGLGAAAGPIGLALGAAAGAALYFGTGASEAENRTAELTAEMQRLGLISNRAAGGVDTATEAIDKLTDGDRAKKLRDIADEMDRIREAPSFLDGVPLIGDDVIDSYGDVTAKVIDLRTGLIDLFTLTSEDREILGLLGGMSEGLRNNEVKAEDVLAKMEEFKKLDLSDPVEKLIEDLAIVIELMTGLKALGQQTADAFSGIQIPDQRGDDLAGQRATRTFVEDRQEFLGDRLTDSGRSSAQRELDQRTEQVMEAAEAAGVALSEAAARIQAASEIAEENLARAVDSSSNASAELIRQFEGFRATPYFDVNALRAGFGSDTVTLADGSVRQVTEGIRVSVADANRDLVRRIGEFQDTIRGQIGGDTFAAFSEEQQAALTSIAYNYGSLPDRIVQAILTGNQDTIVTAIRGLGSDNGGVNRNRRETEADVFLSGALPALQEEIRLREEHRQIIDETLASLRASADATTLEAETLGLSTYERERARAALELEQQLKSQGIVISDQLRAAINAEAAAYAGSVAGLENATNAQEQFLQRQQEIADQAREIDSAFQGAFSGFIKDVIAGRNVVESLADAVGQLGQKLVDIALNQAFTSLFSSGFSFGGGLLSLFGFAGGGYTGAGGKYEPAGIVHKGEYVFPKSVVDRIGVSNLEAIRRGAGYAEGGLVAPSMARMAGGASNSVIPAPNVNVSVPVNNYFDSESYFRSGLATPGGQRALLNFVRDNPSALRQALGVGR
jgi:lambda family phage tail tape measure protein